MGTHALLWKFFAAATIFALFTYFVSTTFWLYSATTLYLAACYVSDRYEERKRYGEAPTSPFSFYPTTKEARRR